MTFDHFFMTFYDKISKIQLFMTFYEFMTEWEANEYLAVLTIVDIQGCFRLAAIGVAHCALKIVWQIASPSTVVNGLEFA